MVKPISYLQTDAKWKNHNYSAKGESKTIGSSGCGVTAAAMVIATLKDKNVTPITTADWSMANGYKALNQGTYYSYFVPQMNKYGIICKRLNTSNLYGISSSAAHTEALNALKNNDWVIACMGKGNWTSSGHYILIYGYENGYVYINDPASTASARIKNTWTLFAKQVKYMWTISVPDSFKTVNITTTINSSTSKFKVASNIKSIQTWLNTYYKTGLVVDGSYGSKTKTALIKAWQTEVGSLTVDGVFGAKSKAAASSHNIKKGSTGILVTIWQAYLVCRGYNPNGVDGSFGSGCHTATIAFQKANGLTQDGVVGANTYYKAFA